MELSVIIYFIFLGKGNDHKMSMDFMIRETRIEDAHSVRLASGAARTRHMSFINAVDTAWERSSLIFKKYCIHVMYGQLSHLVQLVKGKYLPGFPGTLLVDLAVRNIGQHGFGTAYRTA